MKTLPQKAAQKVFDQYGENVDMNSIYGEIEKAMSEIVYGHPDHKVTSDFDDRQVSQAIIDYYFLVEGEVLV